MVNFEDTTMKDDETTELNKLFWDYDYNLSQIIRDGLNGDKIDQKELEN